MYIYLITNKINNKKYIGQTISTIKKRWNDHYYNKDCAYLYRALRKYGKNNFSIFLIDTLYTQKELDDKEQYYINLYNTLSPNGYNLKLSGGRTGPHHPDTKKKISESHMGKISSKRLPVKGTHKITGEVIYLNYLSQDPKFKSGHIASCCRGACGFKSHKGYIWEFIQQDK